MPKGDRPANGNGDGGGDPGVTIVQPRVIDVAPSTALMDPSPLARGRTLTSPPPQPVEIPSVPRPAVLPSEDPNNPNSELNILRREHDEKTKAARADLDRQEPLFRALQAALNKPPPPTPNLERVREPPPDQKQFQKGTGMFLAASALGAAVFGSKSRQNLVGANNAFAAAADGWQQGNQLAYKNAVADWNNRVDQVLTNNKIEQAKYQNTLNRNDMNIAQKIEAIKLSAVEAGNHTMYAAAEAQSMLQIGKTVDAMAMGTKKLERARDVNNLQAEAANSGMRLEAAQWRQKLTADPDYFDHAVNPRTNMPYTDGEKAAIQQNMATYPPAQAGGPGGRGRPANPRQQAYDQFVRETIARTGQPPTSAESAQFLQSLSPPRSAQGMSLAQFRADWRANHDGQEPPHQEITKFLAGQRGMVAAADLQARMAVRIETASNEVLELLPQALETSKAMPRGDVKLFNELANKWRENVSDPKYADFQVANFSLISAYTRAMNPQGIPRVQDRLETHAINLLAPNIGTPAYERQLYRMLKEIEASKRAVATTGKGLFNPETADKDFDAFAKKMEAELSHGGTGAPGKPGGSISIRPLD